MLPACHSAPRTGLAPAASSGSARRASLSLCLSQGSHPGTAASSEGLFCIRGPLSGTPRWQQRADAGRQEAPAGVCRRGARCCCRPVQPRRSRADPVLLPGADQGGQLQQLTGVVQALVLPRLSLAELQSLGQACAATRATVHGLPDAQLRQLAQVRSCWVPRAIRMASSDAAGRAHRHRRCR